MNRLDPKTETVEETTSCSRISGIDRLWATAKTLPKSKQEVEAEKYVAFQNQLNEVNEHRKLAWVATNFFTILYLHITELT